MQIIWRYAKHWPVSSADWQEMEEQEALQFLEILLFVMFEGILSFRPEGEIHQTAHHPKISRFARNGRTASGKLKSTALTLKGAWRLSCAWVILEKRPVPLG
jgi:hypothetical protein